MPHSNVMRRDPGPARRAAARFTSLPSCSDPTVTDASVSSGAPDPRFETLTAWVADVLGSRDFQIAPASADASFRRYFRIVPPMPWQGHATLIAMDAPPPMEDCAPFVHVAQLLRDAGVHAPAVLAADLPRGFLLLTDLGNCTYLAALDAASAPDLYAAATDALILWQCATRADALPPYDEALLRRELDLFPDWYVGRHLGITLTPSQRGDLERAFRAVLDNNLAQQRVFVHRDYHSRNLMVTEPNPGVLDFQDAVEGPITYDLVSLLRDAYVDWDEARQLDWAVRYWERARHAGLPVGADFAAFWRDFEWMGVQRQLKVLGIFARLAHRDGKTNYLADMPRVFAYLRAACGRYRELAPLANLLDVIHARPVAAGYTF
jgi:aminoglycoside/choline kinase family phosphotransferase